jgi:hypothetical protein
MRIPAKTRSDSEGIGAGNPEENVHLLRRRAEYRSDSIRAPVPEAHRRRSAATRNMSLSLPGSDALIKLFRPFRMESPFKLLLCPWKP